MSAVEVAVPEVAIAKDGVLEVTVVEVAVGEATPSEDGVVERGILEVDGCEVSALEEGVIEARFSEDDAGESTRNEGGVVKATIEQVRGKDRTRGEATGGEGSVDDVGVANDDEAPLAVICGEASKLCVEDARIVEGQPGYKFMAFEPLDEEPVYGANPEGGEWIVWVEGESSLAFACDFLKCAKTGGASAGVA